MQNKTRTAWLFLAPMLLVLLLVALWPLTRTIWFSFTDANINNLDETNFIGFDNYIGEYGLFGNASHAGGFWESDWGRAILNTLKFATVSVTIETCMGVAVALLLNQEFKGRSWVRAAVLVPWAIPTIVSAKMWGWILHDQFGLINQLLVDWGVIAQKIAFTAAYDVITVIAFIFVITGSAIQPVITFTTIKIIIAATSIDNIITTITLNVVITGTAIDKIVIAGWVCGVLVSPNFVITKPAVDVIMPFITDQLIVAVTTIESILTVTAIQCVITRSAIEQVIAPGAK